MSTVANKIGLEESDWDVSPEGIAQWCQRVSALQPLIFTDEELAEIEAEKATRKQWECERFEAYANKLASEWE